MVMPLNSTKAGRNYSLTFAREYDDFYAITEVTLILMDKLKKDINYPTDTFFLK